jgi:hypothetical protein
MKTILSPRSLIEKYSYSECPSEYEELVVQAKELYSSSYYCMILAAQRLQIIKDKKMYKDEYDTFEDFLQKEIKQHRATVYKYLKFNELFSDELADEEDITIIQPTKIFSALPLLTSRKINDEQKRSLKSEFFKYTKDSDTSQKEVKQVVEERTNEYKLSTKKKSKKKTKKVNPMQKKLSKAEDEIKELLSTISNLKIAEYDLIRKLLKDSTQSALKELLEEVNQ